MGNPANNPIPVAEMIASHYTVMGTPMATMGLVSYGLSRSMPRDRPSYPDNPRAELPRLITYVNNEAPSPTVGQAGQNTAFGVEWDTFLQLLQIPGQNHQALLLSKVNSLMACFFGNFSSISIAGGSITMVSPRLMMLSEMIMPQWDDPALRVSVACMRFTVTGFMQSCVPSML